MADRAYDIGPVTDDGRAEERALDQLKRWLPFYLAHVDEARGLPVGTTPVPHPERGFFLSSFEERWAEQTPPAVMVVSPGTLPGEVELLGGAHGAVAQWQQVNVTITVGAASEAGTRGKSQRLAAAARFVLAQQVRGDVVRSVRLMGQRYDLRIRSGASSRSRQRLACGVRAALLVPDVVHTLGSFPRDPDDLTYVVPDSAVGTVTLAANPVPEPPTP